MLAPNSYFACSPLQLLCSEEQGRYLVAAQDIQEGEVVLVAYPYLTAILPSHKKRVCAACFKDMRRRLALNCSGCSYCHYCSPECQRLHIESGPSFSASNPPCQERDTALLTAGLQVPHAILCPIIKRFSSFKFDGDMLAILLMCLEALAIQHLLQQQIQQQQQQQQQHSVDAEPARLPLQSQFHPQLHQKQEQQPQTASEVEVAETDCMLQHRSGQDGSQTESSHLLGHEDFMLLTSGVQFSPLDKQDWIKGVRFLVTAMQKSGWPWALPAEGQVMDMCSKILSNNFGMWSVKQARDSNSSQQTSLGSTAAAEGGSPEGAVTVGVTAATERKLASSPGSAADTGVTPGASSRALKVARPSDPPTMVQREPASSSGSEADTGAAGASSCPVKVARKGAPDPPTLAESKPASSSGSEADTSKSGAPNCPVKVAREGTPDPLTLAERELDSSSGSEPDTGVPRASSCPVKVAVARGGAPRPPKMVEKGTASSSGSESDTGESGASSIALKIAHPSNPPAMLDRERSSSSGREADTGEPGASSCPVKVAVAQGGAPNHPALVQKQPFSSCASKTDTRESGASSCPVKVARPSNPPTLAEREPASSSGSGAHVGEDVTRQEGTATALTGVHHSSESSMRHVKDELTGRQVYISASYFNHSCSPNLFVDHTGLLAVVRATEAIPAGTEANISYIDLEMPVGARRAELQRCFNFLCRCSRCLEELKNGSAKVSWAHKAGNTSASGKKEKGKEKGTSKKKQ